jgi:carbon monoxide dehydrogenase subunit G
MKLHEEFSVTEERSAVWTFFEQSKAVAACLPGVESVTVSDVDNVRVVATQNIGPMSATFDVHVKVIERVPNEMIRFEAVGRSIRGAIGNLRTSNCVRLESDGTGTRVIVDGDVVLAGALGSVGQKVVAKQANKATAQFAVNLRSALLGEPLPTSSSRGRRPTVDGDSANTAVRSDATAAPADPWSRVAAVSNVIIAVVGVAVLIRTWRRPR